MEQVCQGLEGHRPKDYAPLKSSYMFHVGFLCAKCKQVVHVRDIELDLTAEFESYIPDSRATPPYT